MHDCRDRMIVKYAAHRGEIAQIGVDPRHGATGKRLEARQHCRRAVGEIVEHDRRVSRARQLDDDVRSDIPGAAGDEDCFRHG